MSSALSASVDSIIHLPKVVTLKGTDSPSHALKVFAENHITSAPVLDSSEKLLGVLEINDIVSWIVQYIYKKYSIHNKDQQARIEAVSKLQVKTHDLEGFVHKFEHFPVEEILSTPHAQSHPISSPLLPLLLLLLLVVIRSKDFSGIFRKLDDFHVKDIIYYSPRQSSPKRTNTNSIPTPNFTFDSTHNNNTLQKPSLPIHHTPPSTQTTNFQTTPKVPHFTPSSPLNIPKANHTTHSLPPSFTSSFINLSYQPIQKSSYTISPSFPSLFSPSSPYYHQDFPIFNPTIHPSISTLSLPIVSLFTSCGLSLPCAPPPPPPPPTIPTTYSKQYV